MRVAAEQSECRKPDPS